MNQEYIDMVSKLKPLQGEWEPKQYDTVYSKDQEEMGTIHYSDLGDYILNLIVTIGYDNWHTNKNKTSWLPRLDQLFEMVDLKKHIRIKDIGYINSDRYIVQALDNRTTGMKIKTGKTLEIAMLKLVAKLKWNMTWDGKEWRKG